MSLSDSLSAELAELRSRLLESGDLLSEAKLASAYTTFRQRFGPEVLARLDGMALLEAMHLHGSRDSLVYWLEFKNDNEFPAVFGSIAGGSALKFCIYRSRDTGEWTTGSPQRKRTITAEEAIKEARKHRDELMRGAELLDRLPENGSEGDYEALQRKMNELAPDVSRLAWGHKYFSILYPDKLDDYHAEEWQRHALIRLLQVPPAQPGRYVCAARFVALGRELGMPMNHLTSVLNRRNGDPRRYWRIGTRTGENGRSQWTTMREGGFVAIGWADLSELSWVRLDQESKNRLRELVQASYPNTAQAVGRAVQQVFNFVAAIAEGDIVLASDGAAVLGVGRVTGEYQFDGSADFPHRRPSSGSASTNGASLPPKAYAQRCLRSGAIRRTSLRSSGESSTHRPFGRLGRRQ